MAARLSPFTKTVVPFATEAPVVDVAFASLIADVKYFTYNVGASVDVASLNPTTLAVIPEILPVMVEPTNDER